MDKVFDRNIINENSIQAVDRSNVYDFFEYLEWKRSSQIN